MAPGRTTIFLLFALLIAACPSAAQAGWWFGSQNAWEKSGLDLDQGYDQNTVVTVSGTVVSLDLADDRGPVVAVVKTETDTITLVLGPRAHWQEQGLPLRPGDRVSVRGSKAQGQDGVVYLLVQSFHKSGDSEETTLRNQTGRPVWSGGNRPQHQRPAPMRQQRGGRNH